MLSSEKSFGIVARSVLFNMFFFLWTAAAVLLMTSLLILPRAFMATLVMIWAFILSEALKLIIGLKFEVRGRENIIKGGVIYAAKHQSAWDTFVYFLILKNPSYILKKELLVIPFWGWCAQRYRAIIVDRKGGGTALKRMVSDAKDRISRKMPIIIFPEGTRKVLGEPTSYQPGVAALYRAIGVPVVPVAVNSGRFWGRRSFIKMPGTIIIQFLPAIQPGLKRDDFMKNLQIAIEKATSELLEEANNTI